jgi:hypothetical protein
VTKRSRTGTAGRGKHRSAPAEPFSSDSKHETALASVDAEVPAALATLSSLRRSRIFLVVAALLAAAWMVSLLVLAHYTANPVMLNREQILDSPYVVTGTVAGDPASGRVFVEREWKRQALSGTISVANLSATGAKTGITYIFPLSKPDDSLHVTEAPNSNGTPLIYPATPASLDQLKAIVDYQASLRNQP